MAVQGPGESLADRVISDLLSEGDASGAVPGRFSMDREVARRKLREFQLEDPWSYPLDLLSAAMRLGARHVDLRTDGRRLRMRFDGRPLVKTDVLELYDALFTGGEEPAIPARRHLARAIGAAQSLGVAEFRLRSGDGAGSAILFVGRQAGEDHIEVQETVFSGTEVVVDHDRGGREGLSVREAASQLIGIIRDRGIYTGARVFLNGEELPDGWTLPGSTDSLPFGDAREGGTLQAVMGLVPAVSRGELKLVVDGVLVETLAMDALYPGFVGLVTDTRFRTDLGRGALIRNQAYDEALSAVEEAALLLEASLDHDHVEVSFYDQSRALGGVLSDTGEPSDFKVSRPDFHLGLRYRGTARALSVVKRALRLTVLCLFFSPLLLIPKAVLNAMDSSTGDLLIPVFVCLVVVFFALINAFVLLHFFAGPRDQRKMWMTWTPGEKTPQRALSSLHLDKPDPVPAGPEDLKNLEEGYPALRTVSIRGRVLRTGTRPSIDPAVLRDTFCVHKDWGARLTAFHHFALDLDERPGQPLELRPPILPMVADDYRPSTLPAGLHPYHRHRLSEWIRDLDPLLKAGRTWAIWPGEHIEVIVPMGARIRLQAGQAARYHVLEPPCILHPIHHGEPRKTPEGGPGKCERALFH